MKYIIVDTLVAKHKGGGILIDTNLLLLLVVGRYDLAAITTFKRTKKFIGDDYRLLSSFVAEFKQVITTPNILTEVSNLSAQIDTRFRKALFGVLAREIEPLVERYVSSRTVCGSPEFINFGLTDAAMKQILRDDLLVLTDDFPLAGHLAKEGIDVINFNHIRTLAWR